MLNRRRLLSGLALALTALPGVANAAMNKRPFDAKAFADAQAAGKPILIEVSAPWCPICRQQKPILAALAEKPKFAGMVHFTVDFDSQKETLRALRVQRQSTLIVYKGAQEAGRTTGDTNAASIERLLDMVV
jgi:thioredoxin